MILGTWFIDLFLDEKEEDVKMKLTDVFQSKFPPISSNFFEFVSDAGELFLLQQFVTISNGILVISKTLQGKGNCMCGLLYQTML